VQNYLSLTDCRPVQFASRVLSSKPSTGMRRCKFENQNNAIGRVPTGNRYILIHKSSLQLPLWGSSQNEGSPATRESQGACQQRSKAPASRCFWPSIVASRSWKFRSWTLHSTHFKEEASLSQSPAPHGEFLFSELRTQEQQELDSNCGRSIFEVRSGRWRSSKFEDWQTEEFQDLDCVGLVNSNQMRWITWVTGP